MTWINLDRQFVEWHAGDRHDFSIFYRSGGRFNWDDVLLRHRVVLLAEGGSGKSAEVRQRAKQLREAGKFVFLVPLLEVASAGSFESALGLADRRRLDEWRRSEDDGWFILDSIDEAKRNTVRFERVAALVADAITGHEGRAHVIFTGRPSDWEIRSDLVSLIDQLPIPSPSTAPPPSPPSRNDLLSNIIRDTKEPEPDPLESALVVIMVPLDPIRISKYAEARGVADPKAIVENISRRSLQGLAGRPLDLHWMTEFWKSHKRLGSLREMLQKSFVERLIERDPEVAAKEPLSEAKALDGLERVGAALIFSRKRGIEIPDSDASVEIVASSANLTAILPDWSGIERVALLRRSVFEPGPLGTVQLHNDNNGQVRSFLASRWLHRLRQQNNFPGNHLIDLLFAETYGNLFVRPSLKEAAAWLAAHDEIVANEVLKRAPGLLLSAGDPESLPLAVRRRALEAVCENGLKNPPDRQYTGFDHDALRRFAQPDLVPTIKSLWQKYSSCDSARNLLVQLIWLGHLEACCDIVESVVLDDSDLPLIQRSIAARAYLVLGSSDQKAKLATALLEKSHSFYDQIFWELVADLFPAALTLDNLLDAIGSLATSQKRFASEIADAVPAIIAKMHDSVGLSRLITALLKLLGGSPLEGERQYDPESESLSDAIGTAALRLLDVAPLDEAPDAAVDAALRIGLHEFRAKDIRRKVILGLHSSAARRQGALWRVVECLRGHQHLNGASLTDDWQLQMLGYDHGIVREDIDWLLVDARGRVTADERLLAIRAALSLWRRESCPDDLFRRIEAAAADNDAVLAIVVASKNPPGPSAELVKIRERSQEIEKRSAAQVAARDSSWIEFFDRLKVTPTLLTAARPTTAEGMDSALFQLWQLLSRRGYSNSRFSIDSMGTLGTLLGPDLSTAFIQGLGRHWRAWQPKLDSQKPATARHQTSSLDLAGLTGIGLEVAQNLRWAEGLSRADAHRAAQYSMSEINGAPRWLSDLVRHHPNEVKQVYCNEIDAQLAEGAINGRHEILEDLKSSDQQLHELVGQHLLEALTKRNDLDPSALSLMMEILLSAAARLSTLESDLFDLVKKRYQDKDNVAINIIYLASLFALNPDVATSLLIDKLSRIEDKNEKASLLIELLPRILGGRRHARTLRVGLPFDCLIKVIEVAYTLLPPESDPHHDTVYTPSLHDDAVDARGYALRMLTDISGRATYESLLKLSKLPAFQSLLGRFNEMAIERAEQDSEMEPWPLAEPYEFERSLYFAPATTSGLHELAANRIRDIQHDLKHSDFSQSEVLRELPDEKAVQKWVAERFKNVESRSYTVERESHVADEKEPDIRLRSRQTDASIPVEIKITESWSFADLRAALETQLCGQYLRHDSATHGILLLVHQAARARGWENPNGSGFLTFEELVVELRKVAAEICATSPSSPQPSVEIIDVSQAS